MKNLLDYERFDYPIEINSMPDGIYCAEIKAIPGLCAYGSSIIEAIDELKIVKHSAFELMLRQGKEIPVPTVHLEIPIDDFEQLPNKEQIDKFVVL
jgi:predicted RNase H-like HicB family nuclease